MIISHKIKSWLKKFVEWGGLTGAIAYLIDGQFIHAFIISVVLFIFIIVTKNYFDKFP